MTTQLQPAVVRILHADGRTAGTGFVVGTDGLIATCAHVVAYAGAGPDGSVAVAFSPGGETRPAKVEQWRSPEAEDVAILRVPGPLPAGVVAAYLQSSSGREGCSYLSFGFPAASPIEGMAGKLEVVAAVRYQGCPVLQMRSDEITPGFSGAPVYDSENGAVVGMATAITTPDQFGRLAETAFVTPAETLREICPALRIADECPYRGLEAFTEDQAVAKYFFGRERVLDSLLEAVRRFPCLLAVLGPSGSGKSSAVRAGLLARLRQGALPGSDSWDAVILTRYDDPLVRLEEAGLPDARKGLAAATRAWRQRSPDHGRLLLLLDQFEELLVSCLEPARRAFLTELADLTDAALPVTVILVMRDDFYSQFADQAGSLLQCIQQEGIINIPRSLEREDLTAIVLKPAEAAGLHFEAGLAEAIVAAVMAAATDDGGQTARSAVLPLLEFALQQLWRAREDSLLTHRAYDRIGGVTGGLTQWAEQAYSTLHDRGLGSLARRVLTDLVHPGDRTQGTPDTRWRRPIAELYRADDERAAVVEVVQYLTGARLVITDRGTTAQQETVELIHDALVREWDRLRQWVEQDRRFLSWHDYLARRADLWTTEGETADRLLTGRDLIEAHGWLADRRTELRSGEQRYIEASIKQEEDRQAKTRSLVNALSAAPRASGKALAIAAAGTLAILALVQSLSLLTTAELSAYDALVRHISPATVPASITVIKLDDSTQAAGRTMAAAIDNIARAHPTAIGLYVPYDAKPLPPADDRALAAAIKRVRRQIVLEDNVQAGSPAYGVQLNQIAMPAGTLMTSHPSTGVANLYGDEDGVYRAVDLTSDAPGKTLHDLYPAFAVQLARIAGAQAPDGVSIASGLGQHMLINYTIPQDGVHHLPMSNVLSGNGAAGWIHHHIVLIVPPGGGFTVSTPLGPMAAGYIQSNVLATLLAGAPIRDAGRANLVIMLLIVLIIAPLAGRSSLRYAIPGALLLAGAYLGAAILIFRLAHLWIHVVSPEAAIIVAFALIMVPRFSAADAQRRRVVAMLGPRLDLPASALGPSPSLSIQSPS